MSKKENSFKLSLCIPFNVGYHSIVDVFENNNIKVHDLNKAIREGYMIQLEFPSDIIIKNNKKI